jgi:hypothetical protein
MAVAAVVTVAGGAAASAAIFLPSRPHAFTPEQTPVSSTMAAGAHTNALASGLELSELSKSSYAANSAAASNLLGNRSSQGLSASANQKRHRRHRPPAPPVYLDPFRDVTGLQPQRIDMGADFAGSGPVYPVGDAVITYATGTSSGWPGGGWITYQLTDGPAAGLVVYVAEDVQPTVSAGTKVTPTTVIANMFNGADGIETGWAMSSSASAESQLPEAGGVSGGGPFPTKVGVNFDELLQSLGVPAAPNAGQTGYGVLPSNYPAAWAKLS